MLTAMNADMCSKCFVTDPCVKSFISLALVVAGGAGCGNGREIGVQESTLKFFRKIDIVANYARKPALSLPATAGDVSVRIIFARRRMFSSYYLPRLR